ncbi:MAG: class II aldolase family protein [Spirochaetae bacterium HGW-Spirochaetae-2]|nr:MAG: class II aldolase family protein [Spirochaetae bacterium HGW-Spirochaetae-2]
MKSHVLSVAKQLMELGINPLTQGNISEKDPSSGLIVITPHDFSYAEMQEEDLVVVDTDGNVVEGTREPSAETAVHCTVYRERPHILGVIHSEPIYANAFGIIGKSIEPVFVNMAIDVGGAVPVMPFADSGNKDFGYKMLGIMGDRNAIIWANHGILAMGKTLDKAFHCTVTVELGAKMYHLALCHGEPYVIPEKKIASLIG